MSSDIAIRVTNITKAYQIYDKPQDRLKQSLWRGRKQFYREFKALDDVSFEVKKGETVGIIGDYRKKKLMRSTMIFLLLRILVILLISQSRLIPAECMSGWHFL